MEERRKLYTFQKPGSDRYPPHLNIIPEQDDVSLIKIFDFMRLLDTGTLLGRVVPDVILDFIHEHPESGTIAGIEERNKTLRRQKLDIFTEPNIGDRNDWYTDAVFAQQNFTGTNPTTIKLAPPELIQQFMIAAKDQHNEKAANRIATAEQGSLYVQDNSYFRKAVNAGPDGPLRSDDGTRWQTASVSLFHLGSDGKLHPLAIVIDYKKSVQESVTIFNQRLNHSVSKASEATDWPWRYAKTCAQSSDWVRHEVIIHLGNTHLVEEAVIVATNRSFSKSHIIYRLLQPHWLKTLSINAAARSSLVPEVVTKICGFSDDQLFTYLRDAYTNFDFTGLYIPNDLKGRGFPIDQLSSPKFKNYVYGKNMYILWHVLRKFVSTYLSTVYKTDSDVASDKSIQGWYTEMQSPAGGNMKSFPTIRTRNELFDAATMCIHIASPQHTAVNYLQSYYQSFVINKPPALCAEPPSSLSELRSLREADVIRALPTTRPREWLLASHLPHLLSFKVAEDQTIVNYAASLAKVAEGNGEKEIAKAAGTLYKDLVELGEIFKENSKLMDDQTMPYEVMDPDATAISILL